MTDGCRARFNCPTNCFASLHQVRNRLPRDVIAESIPTLVNKDDPLGNFGWVIHKFIDSVKMLVMTRHDLVDDMTHKFHVPLPRSNSLSEYGHIN